MANRVRIRPSFLPDARFMLRLVEAYEDDARIQQGLRHELIYKLKWIANMLMQQETKPK